MRVIGFYPPWSHAEKAILASGVNQIPFRELAHRLPGRTIDAIKQRCQILGLERTGKRFPSRALNESFFESETTRSAYWAGFIAADGCIVTNPRREVRIGLHHKDAAHLEQFKADTGYDGPVSIRKSGMCNVTVCAADRWIADLESIYRIGPRKSQTLQPPGFISLPNALAYSAGYIDGDGCWHIDSSGCLRLVVVGTKDLLDWLDHVWQSAGASTGRTSARMVKGIHRRSWAGRYAKSIGSVLLGIDVPHMGRKWAIAKKGVEGTPCA